MPKPTSPATRIPAGPHHALTRQNHSSRPGLNVYCSGALPVASSPNPRSDEYGTGHAKRHSPRTSTYHRSHGARMTSGTPACPPGWPLGCLRPSALNGPATRSPSCTRSTRRSLQGWSPPHTSGSSRHWTGAATTPGQGANRGHATVRARTWPDTTGQHTIVPSPCFAW